MRILFISYYFPPYNTIGAVRTGKLAKYLTALGHDVRVVSADNQPLPRTLHVEVPMERIVYAGWLDVNRPVRLLLGGNRKVSETGYAPPPGKWSGVIKRLGGWYKAALNFPDGQAGWIRPAVKAALTRFGAWRPDIVYASAMPYSSLIAAKIVARRLNVPWIAELRDLWTDHQYYSFRGLRRRLDRWLERNTLADADGFVTVSEPLADTLRRKFARPVCVVMNGYDPGDFPAEDVGGQSDSPGGKLTLVYTGMHYPGKQDPTPLFQAIRRLGPLAEQVDVRFYGRYLDEIRMLAERCGVSGQVSVRPPVPYKEALRLQWEADALFLMLWNDPAQKGVYTGKLFEYIGSRRPILAVGPADNAAAALIRERNAGFVLADPEAIEGQLRAWIAAKRQAGGIPRLPKEQTAGLSREEQAARLAAFLARHAEGVRRTEGSG